MTRLLLTGAGGFAGHHFLEHTLVSTDWDIVATDSFRHRGTTDRIVQVLNGQPPSDPELWQGFWRDRVSVVTHDLTAPFSPQAMNRISGRDGLDYLIAMASESHVDRSIADPVGFIQNNCAVILNTLELARQLRPRAVVVISTDEVYGPALAGIAHREWEAMLPSNPYAASKAAQEAVAISYWRTYGCPVIITNTMNLIGERQHPEKFIPKTLRAVLAGEEAVVHGREGNIGSRHYLHARNMADAVLFLLSRTRPSMFPAHADVPGDGLCPVPGHPRPDGDRTTIAGCEQYVRRTEQAGGAGQWLAGIKADHRHRISDRPDRYNVASADRIDNLTLARMIADAAGRELKYRLEDFHSTRPGHDPHYGLDPGKIAVLGWKPPVPFAESLERTVKWTMAHPEWLAG